MSHKWPDRTCSWFLDHVGFKRQRRHWEQGRFGSKLWQWNLSPSIHCACCLFQLLGTVRTIKKTNNEQQQNWRVRAENWNSFLRSRLIRLSPLYPGGIWRRSFISPIKPTVHTNQSRKLNFSFQCQVKTSENDDIKIIMWFPQPQIQNGRFFLRFRISSA